MNRVRVFNHVRDFPNMRPGVNYRDGEDRTPPAGVCLLELPGAADSATDNESLQQVLDIALEEIRLRAADSYDDKKASEALVRIAAILIVAKGIVR